MSLKASAIGCHIPTLRNPSLCPDETNPSFQQISKDLSVERPSDILNLKSGAYQNPPAS